MTNLIDQIESLAIQYLTITGQPLEEIQLSTDLYEALKQEVVPYLCSEVPESIEYIPMKIGRIKIIVNDKLPPSSISYNILEGMDEDKKIALTPTQK